MARSASGTTELAPLRSSPGRGSGGEQAVTLRRQARELFQAVGVDGRPRRNVLRDEAGQRRGFEIRNHGHPNATGRGPSLFHGDEHERGSAPSHVGCPSGRPADRQST